MDHEAERIEAAMRVLRRNNPARAAEIDRMVSEFGKKFRAFIRQTAMGGAMVESEVEKEWVN